MKHLHFVINTVLILAFAHVTLSAGQPSDFSSDLIRNIKPHPRLFVSGDDGFDKIKQQLTLSGALGEGLLAKLKFICDDSLKGKLLDLPEIRTRSSLQQARDFLGRIVSLALGYRLFHEKAYLDRSTQELRQAAKQTNWGDTHFLDLSDIALGVSIGYDWLYNDLSQDDRKLIKRALVEKGLHLARDIYAVKDPSIRPKDKRIWWVTAQGNWGQACHAGQLAAALALADEEPELANIVVPGVARMLPYNMKCYAPAGVYAEGPGYWSYGTTYNVFAIAMLESAIGTDLGLTTCEPGFSNTAMVRIHLDAPSGDFYNYSDCGLSWEKEVTAAFAFLGERFHQPGVLEYYYCRLANELVTDKAGGKDKKGKAKKVARWFPFSLIWYPPVPTTKEVEPRDAIFTGEVQIGAFRSSWGNRNALFVGFKAGKNGVGHGHLDLGSFILDSDTVRWSSELGGDNYDLPFYFGNEKIRNTYFRANNWGHSTLLFDRAIQKARGESNLIDFLSTENLAGVTADLSDVQPEQTGNWRRRVEMLNRSEVLIQDDVRNLKQDTELSWQMITAANVQISTDGKLATLKQTNTEGRTVGMDAKILAPENGTFVVRSAKPITSPQENQNEGFQILCAVSKQKAGTSPRMAIWLRPVGSHWPTQATAPVLKSLY